MAAKSISHPEMRHPLYFLLALLTLSRILFLLFLKFWIVIEAVVEQVAEYRVQVFGRCGVCYPVAYLPPRYYAHFICLQAVRLQLQENNCGEGTRDTCTRVSKYHRYRLFMRTPATKYFALWPFLPPLQWWYHNRILNNSSVPYTNNTPGIGAALVIANMMYYMCCNQCDSQARGWLPFFNYNQRILIERQ